MANIVLLCLLVVVCTGDSVVKSQLVPLDVCTCPGHTVSFQCTIIGNGNTVFNVTGCHPLTLLHTGFNSGSSRRQCKDGAVKAYGVHANHNNMTFVSRINVTLSNDYDDLTVECYHEERGRLHRIGTYNLSINPPPPSDVHLKSRSPLTFAWNEVPNTCGPSIPVQYEINTNNCGSCQRRVSDTYAVCTGEKFLDRCHFVVRTVVCGNIIGRNNSEPVYVSDSSTATTAEATTESTSSTITVTLSEGMIVVIVVLVLIFIVIIIVLGISLFIVVGKVKPFFEKTIGQQLREHARSQQDKLTAMNQDQGIVHDIHSDVQKLNNYLQNMSKEDEIMKLLQQQQKMLFKLSVKDNNPAKTKYDQVKGRTAGKSTSEAASYKGTYTKPYSSNASINGSYDDVNNGTVLGAYGDVDTGACDDENNVSTNGSDDGSNNGITKASHNLNAT